MQFGYGNEGGGVKKDQPSVTESGAVGRSRSMPISPTHPLTLFLRFLFGPGETVGNSEGEAESSLVLALILATSKTFPSIWARFGGNTERRRLDNSTSAWR